MIKLNTKKHVDINIDLGVENDIRCIMKTNFHVEVWNYVYINVWKNVFYDIENIIAQNVRKNVRKNQKYHTKLK